MRVSLAGVITAAASGISFVLVFADAASLTTQPRPALQCARGSVMPAHTYRGISVITTTGAITVNCDLAPACTAEYVHDVLDARHEDARQAARDAGWKNGPTGTLLCPDSPNLITGAAGDTCSPQEVSA